MKSGIIRRVDDLGRIVIPKEIRKSMHIKEGDPLEINAENNQILLEPYRPLKNIDSVSHSFIRRFYRQFGIPIALCDSHAIVQVEGVSCFKDTPLHERLADWVCNATEYLPSVQNTPLTMDQNGQYLVHTIIPVACGTELWGAVLLPIKGSETEAQSEALVCARYIANAIADYLSNN